MTAEMLLRCRNLSWELLPDHEITHCYTMLVSSRLSSRGHKTFARTGITEVVTVYDAWLVRMLRAVSARHGREQNLLPVIYHQLRNAMAQLVLPLSCRRNSWDSMGSLGF